MYGLVNKGVKNLVLENFGEETWMKIAQESGVPDGDFSSMSYYPDEVTFALVGAASDLLKAKPEDVLKMFGKHWVTYTAKAGYGELMNMFGSNFTESVMNLNQLHSRMGLTMTKLRPPKFNCVEKSKNEIELEYISERNGLAPMMVGLLEGLSEKFSEPIEVDHIQAKNEEQNDVFRIILK